MLKNEKVFKSDEEYFADMEFTSQSLVVDFNFCEYFFESKHITKTYVDEEEHDYFVYGSAVDSLLTEKEGNFESRFIPVAKKMELEKPEDLNLAIVEIKKEIAIIEKEIEEKQEAKKPFKTLENKITSLNNKIISLNEKKEAAEYMKDKTQITHTVYKHIVQSANELLRQPLYKMFGVGEAGKSQAIIALTINGIKRKGKFDYLNLEKKIIADVKTCANIDKYNPRNNAEQLANYRTLASEKYGIPAEDWDHYLLVVDKMTNVKRSKIFYISKDIINEAEESFESKLREYIERRKTNFYTPITETTDDAQEAEKIREEKCFKCGHYNNCPFSLQKEIDYVN